MKHPAREDLNEPRPQPQPDPVVPLDNIAVTAPDRGMEVLRPVSSEGDIPNEKPKKKKSAMKVCICDQT